MKWDTLKPIVVLVAVCLVVSAALAGTHALTEPIIEEAKAAEANKALLVVLPEGKDFEEVPVETENVLAAYKESNGAGYVIKSQGKGFDDMVVAMVGIGGDGLMTGVKVLEHKESINPDFENPEFIGQYVGKDYTLEGVEVISGATYSSKGLNAAVTAAYEAYGEIAGVDVSTEREIVYPDAELVASLIGENSVLIDVAGTDGVYVSDKGYAFNMTGKGFGGDIHVLVAIDSNKAILGTKMFNHSETPDYGADLAKDFWGEKFIGLTESDEIPMRSGSTVTSTGYKECVMNAFAAYDAVGEKWEAMQQLLPGTYTDRSELAAENEAVRSIYASDSGYLFDTVGEGFGGEIHVMISIDNNGAILGAKMYEHNESPDYGADLSKDFWGEKFVGLTASDELPMRSGSTVSSKGYKACVEAAFEAFNTVKGA